MSFLFSAQLLRYKHFSAGMVSSNDPFPEHYKLTDEQYRGKEEGSGGLATDGSKVPGGDIQLERERYRQRVWSLIAKKEVPKMAKMFALSRHNVVTNNKKVNCTVDMSVHWNIVYLYIILV